MILINYTSVARLENERLQHALAQLCGCPSSFEDMEGGLKHLIYCLGNFIFGLFWFLLIRPAVCHGLPDYVKRKVESIREEHYSIPSLLFRWTQQSDE